MSWNGFFNAFDNEQNIVNCETVSVISVLVLYKIHEYGAGTEAAGHAPVRRSDVTRCHVYRWLIHWMCNESCTVKYRRGHLPRTPPRRQ